MIIIQYNLQPATLLSATCVPVLTNTQKKHIPIFSANEWHIAVLTGANHWRLLEPDIISKPRTPLRSVSILSPFPRRGLPIRLFPSGLPTKILDAMRVHSSSPLQLDRPNNIQRKLQIWVLLVALISVPPSLPYHSLVPSSAPPHPLLP
jgi:hypothetical protein